ncbi:MAG: SdpI family protein [Lachnospiraceae bacterium]|nr:SdpI family protein [Lachnospiraceae bacterium]
MKSPKLRFINYILAVCNLALAAILYPSLPEQIPMNWNIDGTVTYDDKHLIFLMCGMAILFAFLFDILPKIDPRKKNYEKFGGFYDVFCIFMQGFLLMMTGIILMETFRPGTLSVPLIIMISTGILFLFIGNYMPKVRSNYYMGIKTPWTLSSEEVWHKTHRLGGKCFCIAGIIMIIFAFLPDQTVMFWITMLCTIIAGIIPTIMSYIWWKQEQHNL